MASIDERKVDLVNLAERLRSIAEALKRLPADHPRFFEEAEKLRAEVITVAALLLGDPRPR